MCRLWLRQTIVLSARLCRTGRHYLVVSSKRTLHFRGRVCQIRGLYRESDIVIAAVPKSDARSARRSCPQGTIRCRLPTTLQNGNTPRLGKVILPSRTSRTSSFTQYARLRHSYSGDLNCAQKHRTCVKSVCPPEVSRILERSG